MKFKDHGEGSRELSQMSSSTGRRGRLAFKPISSRQRSQMKRAIRRKARRRLLREAADIHQEGTP